MPTAEPRPADASVAELMTQLSAQTSRLVRNEMRLAQRELTESAKHAGKGAGLISAAGVLALFGLATLITAAIGALALVLPVWASALVVAVVLFGAAAVTAMISRKQLQQVDPTPERTVDNVKQDIQEVKDARHGR